MVTRQRDHSLGYGVYFAADDYIGLARRGIIFVIDLAVLGGIWWLISILWWHLFGDHALLYVVTCAVVVWLYLVPLKRSDVRTLGYRLTGCRLVTLQGTRPSLLAMTLRSLFWEFGLANFLLDFVWCGIDQDRQTLRDRFSGICVVRSSARPIGEGPIHLAYYDAMGYNLNLPRVVHVLAVA